MVLRRENSLDLERKELCNDGYEGRSGYDPGVNTGFWSILEDDGWTRMREERCSANKTGGRLTACAVGYSRRR